MSEQETLAQTCYDAAPFKIQDGFEDRLVDLPFEYISNGEKVAFEKRAQAVAVRVRAEAADEIAVLRQQLEAERERREKAQAALVPWAGILDHITSEIDPKSMWRVKQDFEDADFTGREVLVTKAALSAPAQRKENDHIDIEGAK
jgi:hypothetical protein